MTTGEKIKSLRNSLKLTQNDFARSIGVSRRSIMDWEHDKFAPNSDSLIKICKTYGLSLDYFISDDDILVDNNSDAKEVSTKEEARPEVRGSIYAADLDSIDNDIRAFLSSNNKHVFHNIIKKISILAGVIMIITSLFIDMFYLFLSGFILIFLGLLINRRIRSNYFARLQEDRLRYIASKGTALTANMCIYYIQDSDNLSIYQNDNLMISVDINNISRVKLYLNNSMVNDLIPEVNYNDLYLFGVIIYYTDGNASRILIGAKSNILPRLYVDLNNRATIALLNKFKIKYDINK